MSRREVHRSRFIFVANRFYNQIGATRNPAEDYATLLKGETISFATPGATRVEISYDGEYRLDVWDNYGVAEDFDEVNDALDRTFCKYYISHKEPVNGV